MVIEGINIHRLEDNPLEQKYAEAWAQLNGTKIYQTPMLGYLLSKTNDYDPGSKRDQIVAATVIQWLGSPVGQNFVRDVLEENNA